MDDGLDITPGAALADPAVQATLESWRNSWFWWRNDKQKLAAIQNVLAHFPWRECQYKYGRWTRMERLFDAYRFFPMTWGRTYETVQLLDPVNRQPVGELRVGRLELKLRKYSGTVRFAGDPRVGGVVWPAGKKFELSLTCFVSYSEALAQLQVLRPGDTPPPEFLRYLHEPPTPNRPWVADHPSKPPKPAKPAKSR